MNRWIFMGLLAVTIFITGCSGKTTEKPITSPDGQPQQSDKSAQPTAPQPDNRVTAATEVGLQFVNAMYSRDVERMKQMLGTDLIGGVETNPAFDVRDKTSKQLPKVLEAPNVRTHSLRSGGAGDLLELTVNVGVEIAGKKEAIALS